MLRRSRQQVCGVIAPLGFQPKHHPPGGVALRLVAAVAGKIDEDWAAGKTYLIMKRPPTTRNPKASRSKLQVSGYFAPSTTEVCGLLLSRAR